MKRHWKRLGLILALCGLPFPANAQPAAETFAETVDVEVVNVEVFVTDRQGRPITGLGREDFELRLDGQPMPISYFYAAAGGRTVETATDFVAPSSTPSPPPAVARPPDQQLRIAVVVDNGHIKAGNRKRVFAQLRTFLDTRLADDVLVTVVSLNPELVVHCDLLRDRRAVAAILNQIERASDRPRTLESERRQILNQLSTTGRIYNRADYTDGSGPDSSALVARIRAYAQSEFNRSQMTLRSLGRVVSTLAGVPGRKALLHISDGIANRPGEEMFAALVYRYGDGTPAPQGLRSAGVDSDYFREIGRFDLIPQFRQLAQLANAARVSWYAIDAESDHAGDLRSAATRGGVATEALDALETNVREPAELTATLTGGRRLQVSARDLDLAAIASDFDSYYSLGFTAPEESEDRPHRLKVKVRGKGIIVRHRDSWKPKSSDERSAEKTTAALLYHTVSNPLGIEVGLSAPERRDDGNFVLHAEISIPLANLLLVPRGDVSTTQLSFFVTTRDRHGQARRIQKLPFNASIPVDKLEEALKHSVRYALPMVVRPGDRQIALGVRDDFGRAASYVRLDLGSLDLGS